MREATLLKLRVGWLISNTSRSLTLELWWDRLETSLKLGLRLVHRILSAVRSNVFSVSLCPLRYTVCLLLRDELASLLRWILLLVLLLVAASVLVVLLDGTVS